MFVGLRQSLFERIRRNLIYIVVEPVVEQEISRASPREVDIVKSVVFEIVDGSFYLQPLVQIAQILFLERSTVVFAVSRKEKSLAVFDLDYARSALLSAGKHL